jgi:hypothetical protein
VTFSDTRWNNYLKKLKSNQKIVSSADIPISRDKICIPIKISFLIISNQQAKYFVFVVGFYYKDICDGRAIDQTC